MKVRLPDKDTTGIDLTRTDYIELRDYMAIEILKGIMLRWEEPGYTDGGAINEAYNLADTALETRKIKR